MKKLLTLFAALFCVTTLSAQTNVSTDQELRDAIADKASIKLTADIVLSNKTLSIPEGTTVTIDLGGYALDRKLTKRGREQLIESLTKEMKAAAKILEFEAAAKLRDRIKQLREQEK